MAKLKKPLSGGAKLKAAGRRAVMLGLSPDVHAVLSQAAAIEMRPLSQFIIFYAIGAANEVIVDSELRRLSAKTKPRPKPAT